MSGASVDEQRGANLDRLTRDESERLQQMNAEYRSRFGFPFLYAVKGSTKEEVLAALERRRTAPIDEERQEAVRQVFRIARFRLDELIGG
jgi:2-oxo-4-hydroxy-4-carboxy-5-ureidoimidazoline decarboxylase